MSLILREKTEGILKEAGLPEFHTQISGKYMQIVGQCGQPITTIKGILFSRNAPSVKEIDYSIRLFKEFLTTHKELLKKYRDTKKRTKVLELDIDIKTEFEKIKGMERVHYNTYGGGSLNFYIGSYSYNVRNTEKGVLYSSGSQMTLAEAKENTKKISKMDENIVKIFKMVEAQNAVKAELNKIKADLGKCDI